MSDASKPPTVPSADTVSARIRARIVKAKRRFHANDNISAFIEPINGQENPRLPRPVIQ